MRRQLVTYVSVTFVVAVLWSVHNGFSQEKTAKDAEKGKKAAAETKGRLPNNYGQVGLSEEQRNKIYALQAKYNGDIEKLEAQIMQLTTQRDMEIFAVLTPEQKTKFNELRDAAKKKTDGAKGAKDGDAKPKEKAKD